MLLLLLLLSFIHQKLKDAAWLLYDTALLESGFAHDDVPNFSQRVLKAMTSSLGIDGTVRTADRQAAFVPCARAYGCMYG